MILLYLILPIESTSQFKKTSRTFNCVRSTTGIKNTQALPDELEKTKGNEAYRNERTRGVYAKWLLPAEQFGFGDCLVDRARAPFTDKSSDDRFTI